MNRKLASACIGAGSLLTMTAFIVSAQTTNADPIELFAKLMPVFTHSRCENCHGAVNPFAGNTHDGGVIPAGFDWTVEDMGMRNAACLTCHTTAADWRLAPRHLAFVNLDAKALCQLQADQVRRLSPAGYISHLEGDILIDLAFEGYSGGASEVPAPPAMSKQDFLAAARAWLSTGRAGCGGWVGTITQTETFAANYAYPIQAGTGPSTMTVKESASRVLALDRSNGQVTVKIEQRGHNTTTGVIRDIGPKGPCTSTATSNSDWIGLNSGPAAGRASIEIKPDGSYAIQMIGPTEKTSGDGSSDLVTDCGPLPTVHDTNAPIELDWDPWTFTIRCPADFTPDKPRGESIDCDLFDPERFPFLKGTMTRVIINESDADNRQSWLRVSPTGVSRSDTGQSLPLTIVTEWDLKIEE